MNNIPPPAHAAIIADGRAVREMRKQVHKQNVNPQLHKVEPHETAKHNLIHSTSSGSINRG